MRHASACLTQGRLDFADAPAFAPRKPAKIYHRRRLPAKAKGWAITPEALEVLRTMKQREVAKREQEEAQHAT
ncbi:MAG TPA: hypothetical protein VMV10_11085 [Pirellulales bacterium]|nr:hypothetical protein [Pirellulales bacterium]